MSVEAVPALLLGAVLGDSDAKSMAWSRAIGALSREVEHLSLGLSTPVRVNVVYHVDGRVAPNEFEGVRSGRFNHGKSLLVVQAAVPADMPDEPERLLLELLEASVAAAESFARQRRLADGLPALRGLVRRISAEKRSGRM
jgi:hypothetical protein